MKSGQSPDPKDGKHRYNKSSTVSISQQLNKYRKRRYKRTSNLLTGETKLTKEEIKVCIYLC